jgi:predicted transport protein
MHYNTTNETGQLLISFNKKTESQKETVYTFFKSHPTGLFTTVEVQEATEIKCHASVKRSVSELKNEHKLLKTDIKVIGEWGHPVHKYKLLESL